MMKVRIKKFFFTYKNKAKAIEIAQSTLSIILVLGNIFIIMKIKFFFFVFL